jgi:hypothetical protein
LFSTHYIGNMLASKMNKPRSVLPKDPWIPCLSNGQQANSWLRSSNIWNISLLVATREHSPSNDRIMITPSEFKLLLSLTFLLHLTIILFKIKIQICKNISYIFQVSLVIKRIKTKYIIFIKNEWSNVSKKVNNDNN